MRFLLFLSLFISFISCDDGDFDQLQFNFETTVNTCGNYVLYRMSSEKTEALVIVLAETDITQEVGETTIPITETNVIYRIFNESVGNNYFCASVPPIQPTVLKEWKAVSGVNNVITIETSAVYDEKDEELIAYKHELQLTNLVLDNEGIQEKYETYLFGSFTTALVSKAHMTD